MGTVTKRPIKEGLWTLDKKNKEAIRLLGHQCNNCGEIHFPRCEMGFCGFCQSQDLAELELSSRGKIHAHTVVMQRPPEYYQGPVPYAMGFVELPEGVRVQTLFSDCDFDRLKVGMAMELILKTLYQDDAGDEVETYMFRPSTA